MIGNVPQGLPTTVTACLFIIADRMGAQNVFVKKLDIVETLGSCTCICTDKTGTLTQNLMSVANFWFVNSTYTDKEILARNKETSAQLETIINIAGLNSRVLLESKDGGEVKPNGDATELGLYRMMSSLITDRHGKTIEDYRREHPKLHEIPFNSSNKWQMSVHQISMLSL